MPEKLPVFQPIPIENIPPASVLLFYGGNWITQLVGNKIYGHRYKPAAFHAAGYIGENEVLNIGKTATIEYLTEMRASTQRIDVVILRDISQYDREVICRRFRRDAGRNIYDTIGYMRFGGKLKCLRWLKKIKASDRNDFCSDNCVDNFSKSPWKDESVVHESLRLSRGFPISEFSSEDTAPWHIAEYAYEHPSVREVCTYHIGDDFIKKFG